MTTDGEAMAEIRAARPREKSIREREAAAWDEGHRHRWRRDPDDGCACEARASSECGCGQYGMGELLSLSDNPYREGKSDD